MPARSGNGNWSNSGTRRTAAGRSAGRRAVAGSSLIEGGFGDRSDAYAKRRARRRQTARVAAPLLVPLALALTLGIILAVSSGAPVTHVNQQMTGTTATSTARP